MLDALDLYSVVGVKLPSVIYRSEGAFVNSIPGVGAANLPYPSGGGAPQAGDQLIMVVACGAASNIGGTGGWTVVVDTFDNVGTLAHFAVYKKTATGSETGSVAVTINGGGSNQIGGKIICYSTDGTGGFAVNGSAYTGVTSGTSPTATADNGIGVGGGITERDIVLVWAGASGNAIGFSAEALSLSGVTFSGPTERVDQAMTGIPKWALIAEFNALSGTSTNAVQFSATLGASVNTFGQFIRIRAL